jgi:SMI1 / KNR4 family (SUKH-1)
MTDQNLQEYLEALKSKGWRVELWDGETPPALDSSFTLRYPRIPADYVKFLEHVKLCENADETVWFLCLNDYSGTSDSEWAWDAMEQTYLEDEDDETRRAEVVEFWNRHMPFMFSIGGEYAYLAFRISDGAVVEGYEDLTEATERAKSFEEFMRLHSAALQGDSETMFFDYV